MATFANIIARINLLPEWLAAPSLLGSQRRELEDRGVDREAIDRAGGLSWSRVSTAGRCYMPNYVGEVLIVQPVWADAAPSIYRDVETPILIDLIAWMPSEPEIWWYRLGDKSLVLGAENLDLAHAEGWPITLETTPLGWLQAGCRGAVLLNYCERVWCAEREAEDAESTAIWWRGAAT